MKCSVCHKSADTLDKRLLNADGDFACGEACEKVYKAERDDFFNRIVHSEELTGKYLRGEEVPQ